MKQSALSYSFEELEMCEVYQGCSLYLFYGAGHCVHKEFEVKQAVCLGRSI